MIRIGCRWPCKRAAVLVVVALASLFAASADAAGPNGGARQATVATAGKDITQVEGISVQGSDEFPKVLHIIPWRAPTLSRRARPKLKADMPDLLQAQEPDVLATQRHFRQTGDILSAPGSGS